MPVKGPDCLLDVVPQPTDSRLSETIVRLETSRDAEPRIVFTAFRVHEQHSCEYTPNYDVEATSPLRQRTDLRTENISRDTLAASRSPLKTVMLLSPGQKHNTFQSVHANFFRCLTLTLTRTLISNCFVR